MASRVEVESAEFALEGGLRGVGIDVLARGRVSLRLAERRYTERERAAFAEARDVPFAAREAVIKAVGGAGVLGAPLREIELAWEGGRLVLRPGPRYRDIMTAEGVASVRLFDIAARHDHVIVGCLAASDAPPSRVRVAWALVAVDGADETTLSPEEAAFARTRPTPRASIATRNAAHAAARALGLADPRVIGGGDDPPRLAGVTGAHLSLAHEDHLAAALVALTAR